MRVAAHKTGKQHRRHNAYAAEHGQGLEAEHGCALAFAKGNVQEFTKPVEGIAKTSRHKRHTGVQQKQGRYNVEQLGSGGREAQQGLAQQQRGQAANAYCGTHHVGGRDTKQTGKNKGYPQKGHASFFFA